MDINVIKNLIQKHKYTVIYIFFFYGTMSYGLMTLLNHIVGDDLAINYLMLTHYTIIPILLSYLIIIFGFLNIKIIDVLFIPFNFKKYIFSYLYFGFVIILTTSIVIWITIFLFKGLGINIINLFLYETLILCFEFNLIINLIMKYNIGRKYIVVFLYLFNIIIGTFGFIYNNYFYTHNYILLILISICLMYTGVIYFKDQKEFFLIFYKLNNTTVKNNKFDSFINSFENYPYIFYEVGRYISKIKIYTIMSIKCIIVGIVLLYVIQKNEYTSMSAILFGLNCISSNNIFVTTAYQGDEEYYQWHLPINPLKLLFTKLLFGFVLQVIINFIIFYIVNLISGVEMQWIIFTLFIILPTLIYSIIGVLIELMLTEKALFDDQICYSNTHRLYLIGISIFLFIAMIKLYGGEFN